MKSIEDASIQCLKKVDNMKKETWLRFGGGAVFLGGPARRLLPFAADVRTVLVVVVVVVVVVVDGVLGLAELVLDHQTRLGVVLRFADRFRFEVLVVCSMVSIKKKRKETRNSVTFRETR